MNKLGGRQLLGQCHSASLIEGGSIRSTTPASEWHALCGGTKVGANARVFVCECTCHAGQVRCVDCGLVTLDTEAVVAQAGQLRCVDREACVGRLKARMDANPALAGARARRAETAARKASGGKSKPKTGRCEHCGGPTGGGRFQPGHDAKLKSDLAGALKGWLKGHFEGDPRALVPDAVELTARGWMPDSLWGNLPGQFRREVESYPLAGFLEERTANRLRAVKGAQ